MHQAKVLLRTSRSETACLGLCCASFFLGLPLSISLGTCLHVHSQALLHLSTMMPSMRAHHTVDYCVLYMLHSCVPSLRLRPVCCMLIPRMLPGSLHDSTSVTMLQTLAARASCSCFCFAAAASRSCRASSATRSRSARSAAAASSFACRMGRKPHHETLQPARQSASPDVLPGGWQHHTESHAVHTLQALQLDDSKPVSAKSWTSAGGHATYPLLGLPALLDLLGRRREQDVVLDARHLLRRQRLPPLAGLLLQLRQHHVILTHSTGQRPKIAAFRRSTRLCMTPEQASGCA